MIIDKIWKLTNTLNAVRVELAPRSSHAQRQATSPDNVCSYSLPVMVCHYENLITFCVSSFFFKTPRHWSRNWQTC